MITASAHLPLSFTGGGEIHFEKKKVQRNLRTSFFWDNMTHVILYFLPMLKSVCCDLVLLFYVIHIYNATHDNELNPHLKKYM